MIDIHTHVLPVLDDGAPDFDASLEMLRTESEQGVNKVILTPHYRGEYKASHERVKDVFVELKKKAADTAITVDLYLGQEIYYKDAKSLLREQKVLTMNGTNFVLLEFDFEKPVDMSEVVYELNCSGYIPIVSHVERYFYADVDQVREIKSAGGLIQVNADSLVGRTRRYFSKFIKKLLKEKLVDFIASDVHYDRSNLMMKAYSFVSKKYGKDTADSIFKHNAEKILEG